MCPRTKTIHRRAGLRRVAGAALAVAATIAVGVPAASARDRSVETFSPVRKTDHALIFKVTGVAPDLVEAARARLRPADRDHKQLERRISVRRVQRIASRGGRLRVSKPDYVRNGTLQVQLNGREATPGTESANCAVDATTVSATGCNLFREDTGSARDPQAGLWGSIDCASTQRYGYSTGSGDPKAMAMGGAQGNDTFRRLTVVDGDDLWGERCELGRNTHRYGVNAAGQTNGTFALYEEGDRRVTFFSQRYPDNFSTSVSEWQTIAQMKQAQPADNGGGAPVLELQMTRGLLVLNNRWNERWSTPAPANNVWVRYAMDVKYSTDPNVGWVKIYVDLNGDGDALDAGEQSPQMNMQTVLPETNGPLGDSDGLSPGDPIPDHLRLGVYHSQSISCPPPVVARWTSTTSR